MTEPKQIATLPPIEELRNDVPLSPRTGEPQRPALLLLASILFYLSALAIAVGYAWHWWLATHPDDYLTSAQLIAWVEPDPGKWLSLTLEAVFAAVVLLAAGAGGIAAFQSWNGWRWSRWAGLITVGLVTGWAIITNYVGYIALGLAALGAALPFVPPVATYFAQWDQVRAKGPAPYRRPDSIVYGRLSRFR